VSIKSNAFGRVLLTDADAQKFKRQVAHGRPKKTAAPNLAAGVKLSNALRRDGAIKLKLKDLV